MKGYEMAALIVLAILIIFFFYIASAKADKRRITLVNAEGEKIGVDAEIARSPPVMMKGLMGRKSIGEYEGMVFVFPREGIHSFWMLNTTIPLDAIFISSDGGVVDVIQMEPCGFNVTKCRSYVPKAASLYVLEVNKGFSEKNAIVPGKSSLVLPVPG